MAQVARQLLFRAGGRKFLRMTWSNDLYLVNVKEIDDEHQRLFQMIAELQSGMRLNYGEEMLADIYIRLLDYTKSHFATEEKLMQAHGFPETKRHLRDHAALAAKVARMEQRRMANNEKLSVKTLTFLYDWLSHHILVTDKNLGRFLNSKGIL